jgi:hypothetical protein
MTPGKKDKRGHGDPTKDKYLKLETKVGAAEYEIAANLTEDSKALNEAEERRRREAKQKVEAARTQLERDVPTPSHKSDEGAVPGN